MSMEIELLKILIDEVKSLKSTIVELHKQQTDKAPIREYTHPKGFCGDVDCWCNVKKPEKKEELKKKRNK